MVVIARVSCFRVLIQLGKHPIFYQAFTKRSVPGRLKAYLDDQEDIGGGVGDGEDGGAGHGGDGRVGGVEFQQSLHLI